ncbi:MAG TPA: HAMP domain-containing sensor histidine kinase [Bacteroidia bacterium]|nr:HAMP domain-containing sensor histidine kinase [Bacteroidia bacterium]HNU32180.1 HAMP domain-containing sensor histidine kinase [Bacteroidia bacterium]
MSRTRLFVIAALMSVALVGIIYMQVNWIVHDYEVIQEQFNTRVNEALHNVADRLETKEAYSIISNRLVTINNDSVFSVFRNKESLTEFPEEPPEPPLPPKISSVSSPLYPPDYPDPLDDESFDEIKMEVRNVGGRKIILRHNNNVITIDESSNAIIAQTEKLEQKKLLLQKQREKIDSKLKKFQSVMNEVAIEFATDDRTLQQRVNQKQLDSLIRHELNNKGINIEYDYGVSDDNFSTLAYANRGKDVKALSQSHHIVDLFPNDVFSQPVFLSVIFPQDVKYFLSGMWPMLLSSSAFSLIIVLGLAYTIHVILRQKKLGEIKNDFINNMTHEFKTPIATISLASDAVANPKIYENKDSVARYMGIIKEENARMHKHVETILQMALLDKKNFNIKSERILINELVAKAVEQIRLQVENKEGKIEFAPADTVGEITGDYALLLNAVLNLLDNANKYTPEKPEIIVTTQLLLNAVHISVKDNGIGMSKDVQKNIFEKFYRATSGNVHDVKGFGLGLSFVKAIALAHKGDVRVTESTPGKGTTIQLIIPVSSSNSQS